MIAFNIYVGKKRAATFTANMTVQMWNLKLFGYLTQSEHFGGLITAIQRVDIAIKQIDSGDVSVEGIENPAPWADIRAQLVSLLNAMAANQDAKLSCKQGEI